MRCKTVRRLMTDYVDGLLGDAKGRAVRGHLADCADCRAAEETARVVPDALAAWKDVPPPEDGLARLEARVALLPPPVASVGPDGRGRIVRFAVPYAAGFATAAAVLLAAWAVFLRPDALPAAPAIQPDETAFTVDSETGLLPGEVPLRVVDPDDGGLRVIDWPRVRRDLSREQLELLGYQPSALPIDYRGD
jgi:anti-sigma factor RsiW